jgi:hypothetical protein
VIRSVLFHDLGDLLTQTIDVRELGGEPWLTEPVLRTVEGLRDLAVQLRERRRTSFPEVRQGQHECTSEDKPEASQKTECQEPGALTRGKTPAPELKIHTMKETEQQPQGIHRKNENRW